MNQIDEVVFAGAGAGIQRINKKQVESLISDDSVIEATAEAYLKEMEQEKQLGDDLISLIPRLKNIRNHFGELNQLNKMMEEAKEYIESGADEEIVDIFLVSFQHVIMRKELRDLLSHKVERTEERIQSRYYEVEN